MVIHVKKLQDKVALKPQRWAISFPLFLRVSTRDWTTHLHYVDKRYLICVIFNNDDDGLEKVDPYDSNPINLVIFWYV